MQSISPGSPWEPSRSTIFSKSCASPDATRAISSSRPAFQEGVNEIGDLVPEMMLEGVVTNVTKFGAFVDVGVHQDGLVHISELSNRYVKDPSDVVKAGQIVKVRVLSADAKTKRIALSMKTAGAPGVKAAGSAMKPPLPVKRVMPQPRVAAQVLTMEDKLAALSSRWKVR